MTVRYIYRTNGDYVAFIKNDNLFSPNCEWLGVIRKGNLVYKKDGQFLGYLLKDDRIARKNNELPKLNILQPLTPLMPLQPLQPLKRLPMSPLLYPYEDVFEAGLIPYKKNISYGSKKKFDDFLEAKIIAADGIYLGKVSKDKYDSQSILNPYNDYGSKYSSSSILNPYSNYGSPYSSYSAFNQYSSTPPRLVKNGEIIGYLSKNKYVEGAIDTNEFLRWLGL
jgi:hypothetical protein